MFCTSAGAIIIGGVVALIAAIGGNVISPYILDALRPPQPTPAFPIYEIEILIVILCCILMYLGIIKNYKKKIITLIIPIIISLIYVLLSSVSSIFLNNQIIAVGLCCILSGFYIMISYCILRGTIKSRFLTQKEDKKANNLKQEN